MNMSTSSNLNSAQPHSLIATPAYVSAQVAAAEQETLRAAKQFLDRAFPLSAGSHQDVCSYVVYYQHLLAFFADGSQSGLRQPKQFIDFNGSKHAPCAIVLRDGDYHVELNFDRNGMIGTRELAKLTDLPSQDASKVDTAQTRSNHSRHWLSLLQAGMPSANAIQDKLFTTAGNDAPLLHTAQL
ncbi:MAG: malate synthase [Shewanella sp.]